MQIRVDVPVHVIIDADTAASHLDHIDEALTAAAGRALNTAKDVIEKRHGEPGAQRLRDPVVSWSEPGLPALNAQDLFDLACFDERFAGAWPPQLGVVVLLGNGQLGVPAWRYPSRDRIFNSRLVLEKVFFEMVGPETDPALSADLAVTVNPDGSRHATHDLPAGAPGADVPLRGTR